jgi:type I restriction enzyme S subunit
MELKQGYKQTDLGLIPIDWEVKTLGEIAVIRDGTHQTPTYVDYGVPFYSVESVTNNNFTNTKFITEEAHKILTKTFKIEKGDILMTRIGSIGDCKLIDWDVNASFYVSLALLKIKSNYLASYISHYSKSASFQKETEINSLQSAIPRKINLGPISNIRVLIPTNAEQTAISTALSNIDELITQTEKLIEKKKAIKQGVMQELLKPKEGWVTKKLGDVFEIEKGTQLNRSTLDSSSEFPVYNGGIAPSGFTSSFNTNENTIIISEGGNSCGYVNYIKTKFWRGGHCYEIRPNNYLNKHFAYFLLKYNEAEIMALRVGSGLPNIQRSNLAKYHIMFPDLNEQLLISEILIDLQDSFDLLNVKLQKLKLQKQGMMQALLTGKIRLI